MYVIEKDIQKINGEVLETFIREIAESNTNLLVEAGTTGYKGGVCRETGGRTYLSIVCKHGDFHFSPVTDKNKQLIGVEIACCGDAGLTAIMKAVGFIQLALNDQRCEIDD